MDNRNDGIDDVEDFIIMSMIEETGQKRHPQKGGCLTACIAAIGIIGVLCLIIGIFI